MTEARIVWRRCQGCKFWINRGNDVQGACCRRAPVVSASVVVTGFATWLRIATSLETRWPVTRADDWCGEFEPTTNPQPVKQTRITRMNPDGRHEQEQTE